MSGGCVFLGHVGLLVLRSSFIHVKPLPYNWHTHVCTSIHSLTYSPHYYNVIFGFRDNHILAAGDIVAVCLLCVSSHLCFCRWSWRSRVWPQFFSLHRCSSWLPGFWLSVLIFSSFPWKRTFLSLRSPLSLISPFKKKRQWSCKLWWAHCHCQLWLCWCLYLQKKKKVMLDVCESSALDYMSICGCLKHFKSLALLEKKQHTLDFITVASSDKITIPVT